MRQLSTCGSRAGCAAAGLLLSLTSTACVGGTGNSAEDSPSATVPAGTASSGGGAETGTVEGLFDVNGHDLYVYCTGRGSPTIVYLHGWIPDPGTNHAWIAPTMARELDDFRFCSYDRRNTQRSENVPGSQRPEDIVADLAGAMDAVGEDGPYLLIGSSFGGAVAHAFAVGHPEAVAGIVMLDAGVGDQVLLDRLVPPPYRASSKANQRADAHDSQERINNWKLYRWIYDRRHREPDVPLIYLASALEKATVHPDFEAPEHDARYYPTYRAFTARWSPGTFMWVDAPHFMEPVVPDEIADAVREVARLAEQEP